MFFCSLEKTVDFELWEGGLKKKFESLHVSIQSGAGLMPHWRVAIPYFKGFVWR